MTENSLDVLALQWRPLGDQVVTRGWIEASDLICMTIHTREAAILIDRRQLLIQILASSYLVVTLSTRRDWYIWFEPAQ